MTAPDDRASALYQAYLGTYFAVLTGGEAIPKSDAPDALAAIALAALDAKVPQRPRSRAGLLAEVEKLTADRDVEGDAFKRGALSIVNRLDGWLCADNDEECKEPRDLERKLRAELGGAS